MTKYLKLVVGCLFLFMIAESFAILYPHETESRQVKDLSGKWKFLADFSQDRNESFRNRWWENPLSEYGQVIDMPVPSSYNDITQDKSLRDFMGWTW